jgi:hypothetical protein
VPTFADSGWHVVSVMDPHSHILDFLDQKYEYYTKGNYAEFIAASPSEFRIGI